MDIGTLLSTYWGPLAFVGGTILVVYILKEQVQGLSQSGDRFNERLSAIEDGIASWRETVRQQVSLEIEKSRQMADDNFQRYMQMEKDEHAVIIGRFEGEIAKLGTRVDKNFERLADKIDKLFDYNLSRKE
jgi:hypothetical protein